MSADASGSHQIRPAERASEKQVGKYRLLSELGRGGTANVYLAVARGEVGVNKLVVLKALLPELAEDPSAVTMFMDEARLAAQLNHPNVVQTYEVGTEGDRSVIVMEFLDGRSLSQVLRHCENQGSVLPRALHLRILIEVLEGLHYAHELKSYEGVLLSLVHRDVSPQNVFVTYDGQVKILDFGIAKAAWSTQTAAGVMKGKLSYMAPEQMSGGIVDRRADIYSFGCMLWAAAAGVKLWADCTDAQVVRGVLGGRIPSPKTVNPQCPDELEAITMKALGFNREDRYATALELQAELERFVENAAVVLKRRELGQFVSNLFADARAELRANIEREVGRLDARDGLTSSIEANARVTPTPSTQQRSPAAESTAPARRRAWLIVAASAVAFIAVATGSRMRSRSAPMPEPTVSSSARSSTEVSRPTSAVDSGAAVPAEATPPAARATLGSELEGTAAAMMGDVKRVEAIRAGSRGPVDARRPLPPAHTAHALVAEGAPSAASDAPATTGAVVLPSASTESGTPPQASASTESDTPPQALPEQSCDNPFYIDREGIKRVRPECM